MRLSKRFSKHFNKRSNKRFHNGFTRTSSPLCSPSWHFLLSWLRVTHQTPPFLNASTPLPSPLSPTHSFQITPFPTLPPISLPAPHTPSHLTTCPTHSLYSHDQPHTLTHISLT